ncbi:MAG: hypothetical protein P1P88_15310 [Bacteroidales bacterium]|nr:hypothetical protein [Bacteroidales bacterium]
MSSAGHILDMIKKMQQNEALKNARKNRFRKSKKVYEHQKNENHINNNLSKQNVSNEELVLIKEKIRTRIKMEKKKQQIFTFLSLVIIIIFIFYISLINK